MSRILRKRNLGPASVSIAALAFALTSLPPRDAQASLDEAILGVALFTAVAVGDVTFIVYDTIRVQNGELPSKGWSIAELVVTLPQTLVLSGATAVFTVEREEEVSLVTLPFSVMTGALSTHGIWSLATKDVDPTTLYWASPAIAANTTLTASALTAMFGKRRVFTQEMGIAEVLCTTPTIIASAYKLGLKDTYVPGWAGLTAWSSALFVHGAVSIALDRGRSYHSRSSDVKVASSGRPFTSARPTFRVDTIAPGIVGGSLDRGPAYGLTMRGSF